MKQFNKTFLPDVVNYNGNKYEFNAAITGAAAANNTSLTTIADTLKAEQRKMIVVNVLSKNLKGKTDLYGQPYKSCRYIFTT